MEYKKLGDIATYINGYAFKPEDRGDEGLPIIRIQDLTGNSYDLGFYDGEYPEKIEINDGDVLISWSASLGVYVWNRGKALLNQHIFKVAFDKLDIDKNYFVYAVRRKLDEMTSKTHGATMKHIVKKDFDATQIPYPSLEEQAEIASNLDRVSRIIEVRKAELEKLDELIKARFVEMFGDQESNPKGWDKCTVGDCCTLKSGTSLPADKENEGGPIPYVKVGDMNYPGNERYITTSSRFVSAETAGKGLFEIGSILFPKRGGAIGTNKKRMTILPVCADLNVMGVSSNGKHLPEFLLAYFDMIDLSSLSDGSSVPQINNKNIAPLEICVPPMDMQRDFAVFVAQVDKSKAVIQKSLDETQVLFDSLMQKYFG